MNIIVDFINEEDYKFEFEIEKEFKSIVETILLNHHFPFNAYVSVSIVNKDTIQTLNRENRNIDSVTDVLSFPNIPMENEADFSVMDNPIIMAQCYEYDEDAVNIGDVIICYDRALEQAKEFGHSSKREFCFLLAHSILHLIGYDHINDEERERMEIVQKKVLDDLEIYR